MKRGARDWGSNKVHNFRHPESTRWENSLINGKTRHTMRATIHCPLGNKGLRTGERKKKKALCFALNAAHFIAARERIKKSRLATQITKLKKKRP